MDDEEYFSKEYASMEKTSVGEGEKTVELGPELKIDESRYGINKPIRVVIKAQLLKDES